MQTSGLILDIHDDFNGDVLREIYPQFSDLPESVKTAHSLGDDLDKLPDEAFALVMVNDGEKLRKFACVDEGNTTLSVQFFLKNAHKLPEEAQKTAAANLVEACSWFELEAPEELQKIAVGVGTALSLAMAAPVIKGTGAAMKENGQALHAREQAGDTSIKTPGQLKIGEASGTNLMPNSAPSPAVTPSLTVVKKSSVGRLMHAEMGKTAGAACVVIDVSNKQPTPRVTEKVASRHALHGKYPLDSYAQVQKASEYFDKHASAFSLDERREYCLNMVPRAQELNIAVSENALAYGSQTWGSEETVKMAFDMRRLEIHDEDAKELLGRIEKRARQKIWFDDNGNIEKTGSISGPELLCETLAEFDRVMGLEHLYGRGIPDPYLSLLGSEKVAEDSDEFSEVMGNDLVTAQDIIRLARSGSSAIKTTFNEDFLEEFQRDPVAIFKSLPRPQKRVIMRMAAQRDPGNIVTY